MSDPFPAWPEVPADHVASDRLHLRFRDITQDGRVKLSGIPLAIGAVGWRRVLQGLSIPAQMEAEGVFTVISRLIVCTEPGPVSIASRVDAEVAVQLAHGLREGAVDRIYLNMWAQLSGQKRHNVGPQPADVNSPVPAGRMFAEHVLTRLHAPPGQRGVSSLGGVVPETCWPRTSAADILAWPSPVEWAPPTTVAFGLSHTDPNQHVNTLVFPRLATEAALLALPEGRWAAWRAELGYRKPCFAGDRLPLQLAILPTEAGATALARLGDPLRPHCTARIDFQAR